jgi:hypothetical protein
MKGPGKYGVVLAGCFLRSDGEWTKDQRRARRLYNRRDATRLASKYDASPVQFDDLNGGYDFLDLMKKRPDPSLCPTHGNSHPCEMCDT